MEESTLSKKQLFVQASGKILDEARERGTILRIMGATAIEIHCTPKKSASVEAFALSSRELTDLDFVAYSNDWGDVTKLFADMGCALDMTHIVLHGRDRLRLEAPAGAVFSHVDVFFDKLSFCHTIDFRKGKRLELDYPTIPVGDLLLEKMQIVKINEKDIVDTIILLAEHELGHDDQDRVNIDYLSRLLSTDWGFYYTVTTNLKKIRDEFLPRYQVLTEADKSVVRSKINGIVEAVDGAQKSMSWRMRAKIGTSKKWYNEVEEVSR